MLAWFCGYYLPRRGDGTVIQDGAQNAARALERERLSVHYRRALRPSLAADIQVITSARRRRFFMHDWSR